MIKTIRNMLAPALSGFFIFRFGGESSSSSSSSSTNTSNATDNRLAIGNGSIGASTGGIVSLSDMRDQSTSLNVSDSSNRSTTATDNSNRSVNNSGNTTTVDPGALKAMERAILSNEAVSRDAMAAANAASSAANSAASQSASAAARSASDSLSRALSFASDADATNKSGFSRLLDVGLSMFDSNVKAVQNAQSLTAQAYQTATAEKAGSLDNKTIATLGMAAAAVVALFAFRK